MKKILFLIVILSLSYGCASVGKALNPYEDEFTCPKTDPGKCASVQIAYGESIGQNNNDNSNHKQATGDGKGLKSLIVETKVRSPLNAYEDVMFGKMADLLKEPVAPIVAPPSVIRVLFLSYKGDGNELFMPRFTYFFADDPKWVMGDYILGKEAE